MDSWQSSNRLSFENAFKLNQSLKNKSNLSDIPTIDSPKSQVLKKNTIQIVKSRNQPQSFEESKSPKHSIKECRTKTSFRKRESLLSKYHINLANYIEEHKVDVKLKGTKRFSGKSGDYYLKNILFQKNSESCKKILPRLSLKNPESLNSCIHKCKNVKRLEPHSHKLSARLPLNSLTPIPIIEKAKVRNKFDSTSLSNAERYAVHIRRLEYSKGIQKNKNIQKDDDFGLNKIIMIQNWWKTIYAIIRIQRLFKGWNYRRKLYSFLQTQEVLIETILTLEFRVNKPNMRYFLKRLKHICFRFKIKKWLERNLGRILRICLLNWNKKAHRILNIFLNTKKEFIKNQEMHNKMMNMFFTINRDYEQKGREDGSNKKSKLAIFQRGDSNLKEMFCLCKKFTVWKCKTMGRYATLLNALVHFKKKKDDKVSLAVDNLIGILRKKLKNSLLKVTVYQNKPLTKCKSEKKILMLYEFQNNSSSRSRRASPQTNIHTRKYLQKLTIDDLDRNIKNGTRKLTKIYKGYWFNKFKKHEINDTISPNDTGDIILMQKLLESLEKQSLQLKSGKKLSSLEKKINLKIQKKLIDITNNSCVSDHDDYRKELSNKNILSLSNPNYVAFTFNNEEKDKESDYYVKESNQNERDSLSNDICSVFKEIYDNDRDEGDKSSKNKKFFKKGSNRNEELYYDEPNNDSDTSPILATNSKNKYQSNMFFDKHPNDLSFSQNDSLIINKDNKKDNQNIHNNEPVSSSRKDNYVYISSSSYAEKLSSQEFDVYYGSNKTKRERTQDNRLDDIQEIRNSGSKGKKQINDSNEFNKINDVKKVIKETKGQMKESGVEMHQSEDYDDDLNYLDSINDSGNISPLKLKYENTSSKVSKKGDHQYIAQSNSNNSKEEAKKNKGNSNKTNSQTKKGFISISQDNEDNSKEQSNESDIYKNKKMNKVFEGRDEPSMGKYNIEQDMKKDNNKTKESNNNQRQYSRSANISQDKKDKIAEERRLTPKNEEKNINLSDLIRRFKLTGNKIKNPENSIEIRRKLKNQTINPTSPKRSNILFEGGKRFGSPILENKKKKKNKSFSDLRNKQYLSHSSDSNISQGNTKRVSKESQNYYRLTKEKGFLNPNILNKKDYNDNDADENDLMNQNKQPLSRIRYEGENPNQLLHSVKDGSLNDGNSITKKGGKAKEKKDMKKQMDHSKGNDGEDENSESNSISDSKEMMGKAVKKVMDLALDKDIETNLPDSQNRKFYPIIMDKGQDKRQSSYLVVEEEQLQQTESRCGISHLYQNSLPHLIRVVFRNIVNEKERVLNDGIIKSFLTHNPPILKYYFNKWNKVPTKFKIFIPQLIQSKLQLIKTSKFLDNTIALFTAFNQWNTNSKDKSIDQYQQMDTENEKENANDNQILQEAYKIISKAKSFANYFVLSKVILASQSKNYFDKWREIASKRLITRELKKFRKKNEFMSLYTFYLYNSTNKKNIFMKYFFKWKQIDSNMIYCAYAINRRIKKLIVKPKIIRKYPSIRSSLVRNAFKKWKMESNLFPRSNLAKRNQRILTTGQVELSTITGNLHLIQLYSKLDRLNNRERAQANFNNQLMKDQFLFKLFSCNDSQRIELLRNAFSTWGNRKILRKNKLKSNNMKKSSVLILQKLKSYIQQKKQKYFMKWVEWILNPIKDQILFNTLISYKDTKGKITKGSNVLRKLLLKKKTAQWRNINDTLKLTQGTDLLRKLLLRKKIAQWQKMNYVLKITQGSGLLRKLLLKKKTAQWRNINDAFKITEGAGLLRKMIIKKKIAQWKMTNNKVKITGGSHILRRLLLKNKINQWKMINDALKITEGTNILKKLILKKKTLEWRMVNTTLKITQGSDLLRKLLLKRKTAQWRNITVELKITEGAGLLSKLIIKKKIAQWKMTNNQTKITQGSDIIRKLLLNKKINQWKKMNNTLKMSQGSDILRKLLLKNKINKWHKTNDALKIIQAIDVLRKLILKKKIVQWQKTNNLLKITNGSYLLQKLLLKKKINKWRIINNALKVIQGSDVFRKFLLKKIINQWKKINKALKITHGSDVLLKLLLKQKINKWRKLNEALKLTQGSYLVKRLLMKNKINHWRNTNNKVKISQGTNILRKLQLKKTTSRWKMINDTGKKSQGSNILVKLLLRKKINQWRNINDGLKITQGTGLIMKLLLKNKINQWRKVNNNVKIIKGSDIVSKLLLKKKINQWRKMNDAMKITEGSDAVNKLLLKKKINKWRMISAAMKRILNSFINVIKKHGSRRLLTSLEENRDNVIKSIHFNLWMKEALYHLIRTLLIDSRKTSLRLKSILKIHYNRHINPFIVKWSTISTNYNKKKTKLHRYFTKNDSLLSMERIFNVWKTKCSKNSRIYHYRHLNRELIQIRNHALKPQKSLRTFFNKLKVLNKRNGLLRTTIKKQHNHSIKKAFDNWARITYSLRLLLQFKDIGKSYMKRIYITNLLSSGTIITKNRLLNSVTGIIKHHTFKKVLGRKARNVLKAKRLRSVFDRIYESKSFLKWRFKVIMHNKNKMTSFIKLLEKRKKYEAMKQLKNFALKNTILRSTTMILGALSKYPFSILKDYLKTLHDRGYNQDLSNETKKNPLYLKNIKQLREQVESGKECINQDFTSQRSMKEGSHINKDLLNEHDQLKRTASMNENQPTYLFEKYHAWFSLVKPNNQDNNNGQNTISERLSLNDFEKLIKNKKIESTKPTDLAEKNIIEDKTNIRASQSLKNYSKYLTQLSNRLENYQINDKPEIEKSSLDLSLIEKLDISYSSNISSQTFGFCDGEQLIRFQNKLIKRSKKKYLLMLRKVARKYKQTSNLCYLIKITFLHRNYKKLSLIKKLIIRWKSLTAKSKAQRSSKDIMYKNMNMLYQKDVDEIFGQKNSSYQSQLRDSLNNFINYPIKDNNTTHISPRVASSSLNYKSK